MTELSPHARAACDALRADPGSADERERVRARLSALGVAMTVGAGAALVTGSASAGAGALAPSALPTAALGNASAPALGALTKGALVGAAGASKLVGVPVVVKASLALLVVTSALAAPRLLQPAQPRARESQTQTTPSTAAPVIKAVAPKRSARAPESAPPRVEPLPVVAEKGARAARAEARSVRTPAPRAPLPVKESTLAAESALLELALSALRAGRAERARDLLARHEEMYGPHALLARERERMREELSHLLR